jgi:hypothetical protein
VPVTIGVNEVGASDRVRRILGDGDAGAGAPGDVLGELDDVLGRVGLGRGRRRTSRPISAPVTSRERPMVNRQSPQNA